MTNCRENEPNLSFFLPRVRYTKRGNRYTLAVRLSVRLVKFNKTRPTMMRFSPNGIPRIPAINDVKMLLKFEGYITPAILILEFGKLGKIDTFAATYPDSSNLLLLNDNLSALTNGRISAGAEFYTRCNSFESLFILSGVYLLL